MKKIDSRFRHLPEADALEATKHLKTLEAVPEAQKAYLKEDYYTAKSDRDAFVQKDRRSFLGLIAKSGISAGLLRSSALLGGVLVNRHALAAEDTNKRVVFCYINSGSAAGTWLPTSVTQMNQVTTPYGATGYKVADICHFREVNVITSGHSTALNSLGITNYSGPTMDKRIADVLGATTVRKQLYLGAKATAGGALCSNSGPCQDNPTQALADVFGGTPPALDNTYALSYDAQLRALESVKSKLSAEEVLRFQEHTQSLTKIKANLAAAAGGGGTPTTCGNNLAVSTANMQVWGKSQADIIVAALACGITKVATLQLGSESGNWTAHSIAYTQDNHGAAHSTPDVNPFIEMQRYMSDVPAYLINKLRITNGPDGQPLINSTVVVQVSCMGSGRTHEPTNGPFIVATQMPGFVRGFSASRGGDVYDLNGAIPKGMGLTGVVGMGANTLGLI